MRRNRRDVYGVRTVCHPLKDPVPSALPMGKTRSMRPKQQCPPYCVAHSRTGAFWREPQKYRGAYSLYLRCGVVSQPTDSNSWVGAVCRRVAGERRPRIVQVFCFVHDFFLLFANLLDYSGWSPYSAGMSHPIIPAVYRIPALLGIVPVLLL